VTARGDYPSPGALRSRQARALRALGCACSQVIVSGEVLTMLTRLGLLADRPDHHDVEIERALTQFLFERAGEKKATRVAHAMRDRWHTAGN
jgi:hypothetical protein